MTWDVPCHAQLHGGGGKSSKGRRTGGRRFKGCGRGKAPPNYDEAIPESRRTELLNILAEFMDGEENQIDFPSSVTGLERRFLHEEAQCLGLTSQYFGDSADRLLSLFKGPASQLPFADADMTPVGPHGARSSKNVFYSAVVLDEESHRALSAFFSAFYGGIPSSWSEHCEHMTICMGSLQHPKTEDQRSVAAELRSRIASLRVGQTCELRVVSMGRAEGVCAVGVLGCVSGNKNPHITVACAPHVLPWMANLITHWEILPEEQQFIVRGSVQQRVESDSHKAPLVQESPKSKSIQETHKSEKAKIPGDRRAELSKMVVNFVEGWETQIVFPMSMMGLERKFLHKEGEKHGCTSQTLGQGKEKFLSLFKGSRFQEERSLEQFALPPSAQVAVDGDDDDATGPLEKLLSDDEQNCAGHCEDAIDSRSSTEASCSVSRSSLTPQLTPQLTPHSTPRLTPKLKPLSKRRSQMKRMRSSSGNSEFVPEAPIVLQTGFACVVEEAGSVWQDCSNSGVEIAVGGAYNFLALPAVLRTARTCLTWADLAARTQIDLPPPQVDLTVQFCLLEVLCNFHDDRFPLPMTAIYGEMCKVAKKASYSMQHCMHLEDTVLRVLGPACKMQQQSLLRSCRPHHVSWWHACSDLRRSSFKSLEKMSKHFDKQKLIETHHQRWKKNIWGNTRTCQEWLLTRVNRKHALLIEHCAWRQTLRPKVSAALEEGSILDQFSLADADPS